MQKMLPMFVMLSLVSISCSKSHHGSSKSDEKTQAPEKTSADTTTTLSSPQDSSAIDNDATTPPLEISTLPELALTFDTNIDLISFNSQQAEKYNKAIDIVKLVVATEEFRDRVINYTYNGVRTFVDNRGLTNEEIYQSILEAAESLRPIKNNMIDLEVQLYYANNTVIGYTNGNTTRIWVNTKYFNTFMENSVAGNLFHEWLHKLGYAHDYESTPERPYSVPYAVGYIMGDIGKNFL